MRAWHRLGFPTRLAGGAAAVLVLSALGAGFTRPHDFPAWLEATATAAAFVAAIYAARYAARAFDLETQREARWIDTQKRAQAVLVASWFGEMERDPSGSPEWAARFRSAGIFRMEGIYLRNASDIPVTEVRVRLFVADEVAGVARFGTLPPSSDPIFMDLDRELAAGLELAQKRFVPAPDPEVGIAFRDSAGQRWYRGPDGALVDAWPDWVPA